MQEKLQEFSQKVGKYREVITNESQTRTVLIEPFLRILGYDVTNPFEVIHEYTSDVGTKKGEKVDYAIQLEDELVLIIEAKDCSVKLNDKVISQLYRYYGTSHCRIALLTNGVDYWFFSDTNRQNVMDTEPFYKFNILDFTEEDLMFLNKITRENFDLDKIHTISKTYSFRKAFKDYLHSQVENPSNEFTSFIMKSLGMGNFNSSDSPQLIAYELGKLLGVEGLVEPEIMENKTKQKKPPKKKKEPSERLTGVLTFTEILNATETVMGKPNHLVIDGEDIIVSAWSEITVILTGHAYKVTKDLEGLLSVDGVATDNSGWLSRSSNHMKSPKEISTPEGLFYIDTNASSKSMVKRLKKILDFAEIPSESIELILV